MKLLDLTYSSPSLNLAADEALLDWAEADDSIEVLRFWESTEPFVVVGYGNSVATEVNVANCRSLGIPMLRRCSGGGTVLQGPGCLNYSVILQIARHPELESISGANCHVMRHQRAAVQSLFSEKIEIKGTTDLCVGEAKFSGNAQRRKRRSLLFHGAFLLDFDLPLIASALRMPSREPDYRRGRLHTDFLRNLPIPRDDLKRAIAAKWSVETPITDIPKRFLDPLADRYADAAWNLKF